MGAGNALAAITTWGPRLGRHHKSRVVLLFMATVSLDSDPDPRYWAGVDRLADVLGLQGSGRNRESRVSEAIRVLVEHGAVTRIVDPAKGRRAVYALHLWAPAEALTPADHSLVTSDRHSLVTSDNTHSLDVQTLTQDECPKEDRGGSGTHRGEPLPLVPKVTRARCTECSRDLLHPDSVRAGLCGRHRNALPKVSQAQDADPAAREAAS